MLSKYGTGSLGQMPTSPSPFYMRMSTKGVTDPGGWAFVRRCSPRCAASPGMLTRGARVLIYKSQTGSLPPGPDLHIIKVNAEVSANDGG